MNYMTKEDKERVENRLATLEKKRKELSDRIGRARELGDRMQENFRNRLGGRNNVKDIRGKGLMLGIELDSNCTELVGKALARGLLINVTA